MDIKNPTAPCICCYNTFKTLTSAEQAINDKLQGSVVAYLRCGGVVNNQIKKGLLLRNGKSVNIWQSYKRERDCLVYFLRLLTASM